MLCDGVGATYGTPVLQALREDVIGTCIAFIESIDEG
jgi:hypothetical protein